MSASIYGASAQYTDVRVLQEGQPIDVWRDPEEVEHHVFKGGVAVVFDTMDDDHLVLEGDVVTVRRLLVQAIEELSAIEPSVGEAGIEPTA